jgi:hypothetical protein
MQDIVGSGAGALALNDPRSNRQTNISWDTKLRSNIISVQDPSPVTGSSVLPQFLKIKVEYTPYRLSPVYVNTAAHRAVTLYLAHRHVVYICRRFTVFEFRLPWDPGTKRLMTGRALGWMCVPTNRVVL